MTEAFAAHAKGLATVTYDGTVLDVWYPAPRLEATSNSTGTTRLETSPQQFAHLVGPDEIRGTARIPVETTIADLNEPPVDTYDVYLRLHLLSHQLCAPHSINVEGAYDLLTNVVWTNYGPCAVSDFQMVRSRLAGRGPVTVYSVDKIPRMVDYVVPQDVRIADADRVRLGAYLAAGTVVSHEGYINFHAGTLAPARIEGRLSAGVTIGEGTEVGGGASIMSSLQVGARCVLGANSGLGISLGDDCTIEAGLYLTAGSKVVDVTTGETKKASAFEGESGLTFRRNSVTGSIEALRLPQP